MRRPDVAAWAGRALRHRRLVRAPIWLYRHRLGFLLGRRMVMLEHVGRRSGKARYVVLEVVGRPDPRVVVVASGFGEASQWYRNVRANPEVRVSTGLRRGVPGRAEAMSAEDADAALTAYRRDHPVAWRALKGILEAARGEELTTLPLVRITLSR